VLKGYLILFEEMITVTDSLIVDLAAEIKILGTNGILNSTETE
jgi:hypothetical protein